MSSSSGLIDIRATYGGMSLAVGIILYLLATGKDTLKIGLISVSVLMLAMAMGRIIGIGLDGTPNIYMYIYLALELAVGILALLLLRVDSINS